MAGSNKSVTIANRISGSRERLLLRALGLPPDAPYASLGEPFDEKGKLVWPLRYLYEPVGCPESCEHQCPQRGCFKKHGIREADFVALPSGSNPQILRISIPRRLIACGEAVPPLPLSGMADSHHLTVEALAYVVAELKAGTPVPFLARTLGTSESTVYRIKDAFVPCSPLGLRIDPEMTSFGLDELKIAGCYHTIFVNHNGKPYLGMVRGMSEDEIKAALIEIRENCHIVSATADFSRDYIPVLRRYFRGIVITGDKYHLLDNVKERLDDVRRDQARTLTESELKKIQARAGTIPWNDLDKKQQQIIQQKAAEASGGALLTKDARLFKTTYRKLGEEQIKHLNKALEMFPGIKSHYRLLQRLYTLLGSGLSPERSYRRLCKILYQFETAKPPRCDELLGFFRRNWDAIVAYFWTGEDNSLAESMNSRAREINLVARGVFPEELNRRMWDRYGIATDGSNEETEKTSAAIGAEVSGKSIAMDSRPRTRHGIHKRKKWPFKNPKGSHRQMSLSFQ